MSTGSSAPHSLSSPNFFRLRSELANLADFPLRTTDRHQSGEIESCSRQYAKMFLFEKSSFFLEMMNRLDEPNGLKDNPLKPPSLERGLKETTLLFCRGQQTEMYHE